jgi:hypothetical protein
VAPPVGGVVELPVTGETAPRSPESGCCGGNLLGLLLMVAGGGIVVVMGCAVRAARRR